MIAISRITRTSLNREWRIENNLLNKDENVVIVGKEEGEEEEKEEGGMLAEKEGMLVVDAVVEGSDEAFSEIQVFDECFSANGASIKKELLLVNPAFADVETTVDCECTRERFLRLRG